MNEKSYWLTWSRGFRMIEREGEGRGEREEPEKCLKMVARAIRLVWRKREWQDTVAVYEYICSLVFGASGWLFAHVGGSHNLILAVQSYPAHFGLVGWLNGHITRPNHIVPKLLTFCCLFPYWPNFHRWMCVLDVFSMKRRCRCSNSLSSPPATAWWESIQVKQQLDWESIQVKQQLD